MEQAIWSRPLKGGQDFWDVYLFLLFRHNTFPPGHNWDIRRWEEPFAYKQKAGWDEAWRARTQLWATEDGEIVAVAHPANEHEAGIQINHMHRAYEPHVLDWCEANLSMDNTLSFFVWDYDSYRQRLLTERGFQPASSLHYLHQIRIPEMCPEKRRLPAGYTFRTIQWRNEEDAQKRADLLNTVNGGSEHSAQAYLTFVINSRTYNDLLELLAVAPNGSFAAYVSIVLDDHNQHAILKSVCTHPEHEGRGLLDVLIQEGIRRLHERAVEIVSLTATSEKELEEYTPLAHGVTYTGRMWVKHYGADDSHKL